MIKCPQPQAHPDRCGCRPEAPDAFEIARHSKRLVEQQRERIAALEAECAELDALRERQSYLLSQTAIALRGPEPALTRYSHADIPSRVYLVVAERDALAAELAALKAQMAGQEPVAYAINVRGKGMRTTIYTEVLPFHPDTGIEQIGEPVPLYAAPPAAHIGDTEKMVWCACGDGYPERSFGAGFISALGCCENCDAANYATPTIKESLTVAEHPSTAMAVPDEQLPPLIQCLRENGEQIAERAFAAQEAKRPQLDELDRERSQILANLAQHPATGADKAT